MNDKNHKLSHDRPGEALDDNNSQETREWLESLKAVIDREGAERAHFLLERMVD